MADAVHAECASEDCEEPLTVLVDAIAEYKRVTGSSINETRSTLHELGLDRSVDINKFVETDTTNGKLSFWWDDMYVTVHTTGTITVTGEKTATVSRDAAD